MARATDTRLRGFHVRAHHTDAARSEETEAFRCEIWRGEERVGYAKNDGRGGADVIHVDPGVRDDWRALVDHIAQVPTRTGAGGEEQGMFEPEGWVLGLLRDAERTEASLGRRRAHRSAAIVHRYEESPWEAGAVHLERYEILSPHADVPLDAIDSQYVWLLAIGQDQEEVARHVPPVARKLQSKAGRTR